MKVLRFFKEDSSMVDAELLLWWQDFYQPLFEYAFDEIGSLAGKRVLELGCGPGGTAVLLARRGADVFATDIRIESIQETRRLAAKYGVADKIHTSVMDARRLAFPEHSFDFIFTKSVLIMTDYEPVVKECSRVLKKGGKAIFLENMRHHPIIYLIRKMFIRYSRYLHYLSMDDIKNITKVFSVSRHREFHFFIIASLIWDKVIKSKQVYNLTFRLLRAFDDGLISSLPFLRRICWITAIICEK